MKKQRDIKEKVNFKKVRTFTAAAITCIIGVSMVAFGASVHSHDYYYSNNAWVHSYLDLMNGGMFPDKVYANVSLQGVEGPCYKAGYLLKTNKDKVSGGIVDYKNTSHDYNGKIVGYVNYAKLFVDKENDGKYDGYLYDNTSTAGFYKVK